MMRPPYNKGIQHNALIRLDGHSLIGKKLGAFIGFAHRYCVVTGVSISRYCVEFTATHDPIDIGRGPYSETTFSICQDTLETTFYPVLFDAELLNVGDVVDEALAIFKGAGYYYLYSAKRSNPQNDHPFFWRLNQHGYEQSIDDAGIFDQAFVDKRKFPIWDYTKRLTDRAYQPSTYFTTIAVRVADIEQLGEFEGVCGLKLNVFRHHL